MGKTFKSDGYCMLPFYKAMPRMASKDGKMRVECQVVDKSLLETKVKYEVVDLMFSGLHEEWVLNNEFKYYHSTRDMSVAIDSLAEEVAELRGRLKKLESEKGR